MSELRKGDRAHPSVVQWFEAVNESKIYLSVLIIGEIRTGIERIKRRDERSALHLEVWLDKIITGYQNRILPITQEIAQEWGKMNISNPISTIDGLLAATAKVQGLVLITRNIKDIENVGVPFYNPFVCKTSCQI